ncbi:MAG: PAS domain S-box protein [Thermoleophilia bacterium]
MTVRAFQDEPERELTADPVDEPPCHDEIDPLLRVAAQFAATTTGAQAACVYLRERECDDLVRLLPDGDETSAPSRIEAVTWKGWWSGPDVAPVRLDADDCRLPAALREDCCVVFVPLRGVDGEVVGGLGLVDAGPRGLGSIEPARLAASGVLVEQTLERAQLLASVERLAALQSVVASLGQHEVEPGRLDDFLHLAAERVRVTLDVDWVAVVDLERQRPAIRAAAGLVDRQELGLDLEEARQTGIRPCLLASIEAPDGPFGALAVSQRVRELEREERLLVEGIARTMAAVIERERAGRLAAGQAATLEAIARGAPLDVVLDLVCLLVEAQSDGLSASVMLPDRPQDPGSLVVGAGPSLAPDYVAALSDGVPIGEGHGVCGTAAARRESVVVDDVAASPLCIDYSELFDRFGLRACWSTPVEDSAGGLLATFALYYDDSRAPSSRERRLIELATSLVRVALERDRAAARLADTTRTLEAIVDNAPLAFVGLDVDGHVTTWSRAAEELFGWPAEDVLGGPLPTVLEQDRQRVRDEHRRALAGEDMPMLEQQRRRRDGSVIDVAIARAPLYDGEGAPRGLLGIFSDITARRAAEQALRESEERFRGLVELMPDLVGIHEDGIIRYVNEAGQRLLGAAGPGDLLGKSLPDEIVAPELRGVARDRLRLLAETGAALPLMEQRWLRLDGTEVLVETTSLPTTHDGRPAVQVVARDVTARRRAEQELAAVGRRLQAVIAASPIAISSHDLQGRVTLWSPAAERILGWSAEEVTGHRMPHLAEEEHARFAALRERVIRTGEAVRYEATRRRRDGSEVVLSVFASPLYDDTGEPLGTIGLFDDITERRRAEAEHAEFEARVQHAQKLESLGVLAGGIAHDFNNLLVGILGNLGLALAELDPDAPARPQVERAERAAARAGELTHQMLAYAGRASLERTPVDVSRLVRELGGLVEVSVLGQAPVRYALAEGLPAVEGDPAQLQQVVLNLLTNAADAVAAVPDRAGEIRVETRLLAHGMPPGEEGLVGAPPGPGPCVLVEVSDTGAGMDAETRARIFEPFFTTKFTGRGLGLAAVLEIVRGHGGAIALRSAPGAGTTFRVFLPASPTGAGSPRSMRPPGPSSPAPARSSSSTTSRTCSRWPASPSAARATRSSPPRAGARRSSSTPAETSRSRSSCST